MDSRLPVLWVICVFVLGCPFFLSKCNQKPAFLVEVIMFFFFLASRVLMSKQGQITSNRESVGGSMNISTAFNNPQPSVLLVFSDTIAALGVSVLYPASAWSSSRWCVHCLLSRRPTLLVIVMLFHWHTKTYHQMRLTKKTLGLFAALTRAASSSYDGLSVPAGLVVVPHVRRRILIHSESKEG